MNSNEEYLDNLLKTIEERDASIQKNGIIDALSESDSLSDPDIFPQSDSLSDPDIFPQSDSLSPTDIFPRSEDETVLDILASNPDKLMSPEEVETMFVSEETDSKDINSVNEINNETNNETFFAKEDDIFSDDIQNMSEEDIINLLQNASDSSQNSDDSSNIDFLFDDMSTDSEVIQIDEMIEKAENNEPVSSEVEEMIQLGLKDDEVELVVQTTPEASKGVINMLKKSFSNIFKQNEDEKEKKGIRKKKRKEEKKEEENKEEESKQDEKDIISMVDMSKDDSKDEVDFAFFDSMFVDDSQIVAGEINEDEFGEATGDLFPGMEFEADSDIANFSDFESDGDNGEKSAKDKVKKQGFFKRLFEILTEEEDEEAEELTILDNSEGVDALGITSEVNKEAMAQLDKEGSEDKKKNKKGKKSKKGESESDAGDEDEIDNKQADSNNKKQKPKKQKKQKKQKEPKAYDDSPKLSKKKIRVTILASISITAAILIGCLFVTELFEVKSARNSFYSGDYETSFKLLYGKKLSDSDRIIFEQSELLLALQRRVESYYNYMAVDAEHRAVESLIMEVAKQKDILAQSEKYGLEAEANNSYQQILQILSEEYGVSEEDALKINAYRQDALYTLHIRAIVAGEEFVCPEYLLEAGQEKVSADTADEVMNGEVSEDILPVEEELDEAEFEEGIN